jgi:hypothetical protein
VFYIVKCLLLLDCKQPPLNLHAHKHYVIVRTNTRLKHGLCNRDWKCPFNLLALSVSPVHAHLCLATVQHSHREHRLRTRDWNGHQAETLCIMHTQLSYCQVWAHFFPSPGSHLGTAASVIGLGIRNREWQHCACN